MCVTSRVKMQSSRSVRRLARLIQMDPEIQRKNRPSSFKNSLWR